MSATAIALPFPPAAPSPRERFVQLRSKLHSAALMLDAGELTTEEWTLLGHQYARLHSETMQTDAEYSGRVSGGVMHVQRDYATLTNLDNAVEQVAFVLLRDVLRRMREPMASDVAEFHKRALVRAFPQLLDREWTVSEYRVREWLARAN